MRRRAREDGFAIPGSGASATGSPDGDRSSTMSGPASPLDDPTENVTPLMMAEMLARTAADVADLDTLPGGSLHEPASDGPGARGGSSGDADAAAQVEPAVFKLGLDLAVVTAKSPRRARRGTRTGNSRKHTPGKVLRSRPRSVRFAVET